MNKQVVDFIYRYGIINYDDQHQGIQAGKMTAQEVFRDQDKMIEDIVKTYRLENVRMESNIQGVQRDDSYAFPPIDSPCPQGIQGEPAYRPIKSRALC